MGRIKLSKEARTSEIQSSLKRLILERKGCTADGWAARPWEKDCIFEEAFEALVRCR